MNEHLLDSVDRMLAGSTEQTGGMVALVPREDQADLFAVPGFEPADELHVTLVFLGEADDYDETDRMAVTSYVAEGARYVSPLNVTASGIALFNPHTAQPASVYLVSGGPLEQAKDMLSPYSQNIPEQHRPWVPHMTIGYHMSLSKLTLGGQPVQFDRVRVAFAGEYTDFPLTGKNP